MRECVLAMQAEGYPVDIEKYFHDTHELIDLPNILAVDPALNKMLSRLNKPKYIFTNGNTKHANRVLKILGLSDMFKVSRASSMAIWLVWDSVS